MRDDHVFIMGPPRSGTLMLSRALGRYSGTYLVTEHKKKSVVPEEQNPTPDREFWRESFGLSRLPLEEVEFDEKAFAHLNALWTANSGGRRMIIKNPNNVVRAKEIRRAFPNAQFVWLLRNPWAVIQSMLRGKQAGHKTPMFLGAAEVLKHEDPVLRAAASWVHAINIMRQVGSPADITTRYEDIVAKPGQELARIAQHLSLTDGARAEDVPESRAENFWTMRYLLRRSPARRRIIETVAPFALDLGYPATPPGFPGDDRILAVHYLIRWLSRNKSPPYGFKRLEGMKSRLRATARKYIKGT